MRPWTNYGSRALALALGAAFACAGDQNATTPAETTSSTDAGTTTTSAASQSGSDVSTGTTGTGTTIGMEDLIPSYGIWYALDPLFTVNQPEWWGSGGDALGFMLFELREDGATLWVQDCLFGNSQYEYMTSVDDHGVVVLEPVGEPYNFLPHGEVERLYPEPGSDCSVLSVRAVWKSGTEDDFSWWSEGLKRGELCLECAPTQGTQGTVTDCGTPVPWECPG